MNSTKQWLHITIGCLLVSIGVYLLNTSNLVIGGTAGMSIIMQHITNISFGVLFFIINLPFYFMAVTQIGLQFTIRSFISVSILSVLSDFLAAFVTIELPHPLVGAIAGGLFVGFGLIFLFRNGSSLGGINMLCVFLDKRFGINPGKTMLATDVIIVGSATAVFGIAQVLYSLVGIFVMSAVLGRYHKKSPIEQNNQHLEEEATYGRESQA